MDFSAFPKLLRYPVDIIDASTDYMFVEILKYEPGSLPDLSNEGGANQGNPNNIFQSISPGARTSIILPIPNSIASVNRTGWGESNMSALAGAGLKAAGFALDALTGTDSESETRDQFIANNTKAIGGGGFNDLLKKFGRTKTQVSMVNAASGSSIKFNDVLGRNSGQIVNQNVELLFNSVSIRPFGFNWDLTPRNAKESKEVLKIIKSLKKAAAPKKQVGQNGFLQAPDVFRLTYKKGTADQKFLNKFKMCALTSVGVDYTGSGMHATYNDGSPIHYRLNLSFTELEPVYAEDYGDDFNEAGF